MCFTSGAFQIPKSRKCNHVQSYVIHQNNIKFSFLMTKVTKCWNFQFDTFNNTKYKFLENFTMFLHLWKTETKLIISVAMIPNVSLYTCLNVAVACQTSSFIVPTLWRHHQWPQTQYTVHLDDSITSNSCCRSFHSNMDFV